MKQKNNILKLNKYKIKIMNRNKNKKLTIM